MLGAVKTRLHDPADPDKFWYLDAVTDQVTIKFGRHGGRATTRTTQYPDAEAAAAAAAKQVVAKEKAGFVPDPRGPRRALRPGIARPAGGKARATAPVEPLRVDTADPAELGLIVWPLEEAYLPAAPVAFAPEEGPFDPQAEAERAARIAQKADFKDGSYLVPRWVFTEPVFTGVPSPEKVEWWKNYFRRHRTRGENIYRYGDEWVELPPHVAVFLEADFSLPLKELVKVFSERRQTPLLLRGLAGGRPEAEVAAVRANVATTLRTLMQHGSWWKADVLFPTIGALEAIPEEELQEVAEQLTHRGSSEWMLFTLGLPTAAARVAYATKVRYGWMRTWRSVVAWLLGTGAEGFAALRASVEEASKPQAEAMVKEAALRLHGPGAVALFAQLLDTAAAGPATEWLTDHLPQVLRAALSRPQASKLLPLLRNQPLAELREIHSQTTGGIHAVIGEVLAEGELAELAADAAWWVEAATDLPKAVKLPFPASALPPVVVDEAGTLVRLSQAQAGQLLQALSAPERHPLVAAVAERATPASRDRFAVSSLEGWLRAGAPSNRAWLLTNSGWLGGDGLVHFLAPLVRGWPGEGRHQRAVKGLTALANCGSELALAEIAAIADRVKFAAIKRRAGEAMEEIAAARGLSREELNDRIVPTGGLDERGQRHYDYGARQFVAYLTPEGKLVVRQRDETGRLSGKVLTSLPRPNKSDDTALADEARADFQTVKKTVTALAKSQLARFEQALVTQRRWQAADFTAFIASHPVLRGLLAALVWAVWDGETLVATSRLEDGQLVDIDDEPVELAGRELSVAHPLDLEAQHLADWALTLTDYELSAPFKQLDRPVYTLHPDQGDDIFLHGLSPEPVPAGKLMGSLTKQGWQIGEVGDGGIFTSFVLPLASVGCTAVLEFGDGLWPGYSSDQDDQTVERVWLTEGLLSGNWYTPPASEAQTVRWDSLPPKLLSATLGTLVPLGWS
ncbi:DUF4132 domain-containing protein [Buchananella hordeovulneris]|nr:DUF4132 domain-containing protein [Buchananella hordeovulneris]